MVAHRQGEAGRGPGRAGRRGMGAVGGVPGRGLLDLRRGDVAGAGAVRPPGTRTGAGRLAVLDRDVDVRRRPGCGGNRRGGRGRRRGAAVRRGRAAGERRRWPGQGRHTRARLADPADCQAGGRGHHRGGARGLPGRGRRRPGAPGRPPAVRRRDHRRAVGAGRESGDRGEHARPARIRRAGGGRVHQRRRRAAGPGNPGGGRQHGRAHHHHGGGGVGLARADAALSSSGSRAGGPRARWPRRCW